MRFGLMAAKVFKTSGAQPALGGSVTITSLNLVDFFTFVRACFKQRRKTIYNNLKEYLKDSEKTKLALEKAGIDAGVRAQELDVDTLKKLYEATL